MPPYNFLEEPCKQTYWCLHNASCQFLQRQSPLQDKHYSDDEEVDDGGNLEDGVDPVGDDEEVDDGNNLEDGVDPVGDDGRAGKVALHLCCHPHQFVDLAISVLFT